MKGRRKPTVQQVFADFKGRRAGILKALTTDFEEFYGQCSPEKANLCLYGLPGGNWEVRVPPYDFLEYPEPVLGINFARDGMRPRDWMSFVAFLSDSWLLSGAFFFAGHFRFTKAQRNRLFSMINNLPTTNEFLSQNPHKQSPVLDHISNKSNPVSETKKVGETPEDEENDEENGLTLCGACENMYASDDFRICCDTCATWFHGVCVKVNAVSALKIEKYKCPLCVEKEKTALTSQGTGLI